MYGHKVPRFLMTKCSSVWQKLKLYSNDIRIPNKAEISQTECVITTVTDMTVSLHFYNNTRRNKNPQNKKDKNKTAANI